MMAEESLNLQTNVSVPRGRLTCQFSCLLWHTFSLLQLLTTIISRARLQSYLTALHWLPICFRHLWSHKCPLTLHTLPQVLMETSHLKENSHESYVPSKIFLPEEKKLKQVSEANTLPLTLIGMLCLLQTLFDISSPVLKEQWQLDWWMEGPCGSLAVTGPSLFTAQTLLCYLLRWTLRKIRFKKIL